MSHSPQQRRAVLGAFIGTAIEWYDFFIFGTAAALAFGTVFYPEVAPATGVIAAFATFWIGFLTRPIGGIVFGHLGDRFGRKNTLVVTLLMMGIATTCIGLLPSYAQIGVAAPVLLIVLRAVQGLAIGGEWGGAVLLATESTQQGGRAGAGAWVQQGSPAGAILSSLMFISVSSLPNEQFLEWGWRVPFLFSAVLVIVGLVIRLSVEEPPTFEAAKQQKQLVRVPLFEAFRRVPGIIVLGVIATVLGIALPYFLNTFLLAFTTTELGIPRPTMLNVMLAIAVVQFIAQPIAAVIARRIGSQKVMIGGLVIALLAAVPLFLAVQSGDVLLIALGQALAMIGGCSYFAMLAAFLASAFPANIRYTGVSVTYQLAATLVGGPTPLLAQAILTGGGGLWGVAGLFAAMIALTIVGVWALHRRIGGREWQDPAAVAETPAERG